MPRIRGGKTENRTARILKACVFENNLSTENLQEVSINNNSDCIGPSPPHLLMPVCVNNNITADKIHNESLNDNIHTLIELVPSDKSTFEPIAIQEIFEDPIYDNVENPQPSDMIYIVEETKPDFQQQNTPAHQNFNEDVLLPVQVLKSDDEQLDDNTEKDPEYIASKDDNSESSENDTSHEQPVKKKQKTMISKPYGRSEVENRKKKRNSGKEYSTSKNKDRRARKMRDLRENCRNKCKEKIDDTVRQKIFDEYWALETHDKRVAYVASLINVKETAITRNKVNNGKPVKNRLNSYIYHFEVSGQRKAVCKICFLNTLDETEKFISCTVINKLASSSGVTHADKRGTHTPVHKTAQSKINEVISHINSFPAYESHYSRRHTEKKYLAADLNISKLYSLYCEKYNEKPVSIKIYAREFHNMNLKFKKPKNDTCTKCDTLLAKEKYCDNEEEKIEIKKEKDEHLTSADLAYQAKDADKKKGQNDPSHITYAFDLQQVLQTPYLSTNRMFYLRQLATYNLTINNCSSGNSTHFMWPECTAGRGANEIASCISSHLKSIPNEVKHVVFYSDTCGGQNKNSYICSMFHYAIHLHPTIEVIDHKFLVPGHTHLECDVDHALIERTKKKSSIDIHLPRDWYQLVKSASKNNKFKVEIMDQDKFFAFSELATRTGPLQIKNKEFKLRKICWLRYTKDSVVRYKNSLNEEEEFKEVKFLRKNQNISSLENFKLNALYKARKPISTKKKENLLEIANLLDADVQDYYRNLPTDKNIRKDTDPDVDLMNNLSEDEFE